MTEVAANEIDYQHRHVWARRGEAPPMPAPAAADIENDRALRHRRQKAIHLAIHHAYGMAAGDGVEIISVLMGGHLFTRLALGALLGSDGRGRRVNAIITSRDAAHRQHFREHGQK